MRASAVAAICGIVLGSSVAITPAQSQQGPWYAIAVSSTNYGAAQQRANSLGDGWFVLNSNDCPNFTRGYWIAASGPHDYNSAQQAMTNARYAGVRDAYVKSCY